MHAVLHTEQFNAYNRIRHSIDVATSVTRIPLTSLAKTDHSQYTVRVICMFNITKLRTKNVPEFRKDWDSEGSIFDSSFNPDRC